MSVEVGISILCGFGVPVVMGILWLSWHASTVSSALSTLATASAESKAHVKECDTDRAVMGERLSNLEG